ncbi:CYFA0S02e00496g1_1 [Cyberlindnera fabianii]|nr:CYFA0S02e00496g1_1 [Cyberlindnera fabianii]
MQQLNGSPITATKGTQPYSRVKSSSTVTESGKLFLFGGFDEEDKLDGDVYILDIPTLTWETHRHHIYREGHSALGIGGDDILVYGGISEAPNASFVDEDLIVYNVKTNQWRPAQSLGPIPPQRSRHAACLSADGKKMFISGGQVREEENPLDDLYCYDIPSGTWDGPRKFLCRFDHAITFHDDKIWAFGGLTKEMAHATEISYFDLVTNTTGSIVMHDLPKFEGDHIYMPTKNHSLLLDVVVPLWTFEKVDPCIGLYDLKNLRWQAVLTGSYKPLLQYRWRHTFVHENNLYLIGYPLTDETIDDTFDYKLSDVVQLDLEDLGINHTASTTNTSNEGTIISDLSKLLLQEEFSDFHIIGVQSDQRPSPHARFLDSTPLDAPFLGEDTFIKSKPIPAHSIILLARWPHFRRMASSGMSETQTRTLFIPEPIDWICGLLEYLYTDNVSTKDINQVTGLLILSNVYDLPGLRSLCIQCIYSQGFKIKNVLKIWSRAKLVGEDVLAHNASTFCFYNWGKVVKTKQFRDLPKDELVMLCQEVEHDSVIVNNKNLNAGQFMSIHDTLQRQQAAYGPSGNQYGFGSSGVGLGYSPKTGNEDLGDEESSDESDHTHRSSRFATPQASVYLGNPQIGMNSLGERNDPDEEDLEDEDL